MAVCRVLLLLLLHLLLVGSALAAVRARLSEDVNPGDLIVQKIKAAKTSIQAAVYKFSDKNILEALEDAIDRGVQVKVVADEEENGGNNDLAADLEKAGANVRLFTNSDFSKLHAKLTIFDNSTVVTGSFNWSDSASEDNMELILEFQDSADVSQFRALFDRIWAYGK